MKLVVFGLAVSSSWGNGHAVLWRALIRALAAQGHRTVFFERDVPWYAEHRDLTEIEGGASGAVRRLGRDQAGGGARAARCRRRDRDLILPGRGGARPRSCSTRRGCTSFTISTRR